MPIEYERRKKEDNPVLAICYDFDKTLSPDDMQAQGYIQSVGYDINEFWEKNNDISESNHMDPISAYMYLMLKEAEGNFVFNQKALKEYGAKITLFNGVETWFDRINEYGKNKGVIVEHYIISSGLQEMIEGTSIASSFEKIYACSFFYDERGVARWPAQIVNYTNKTQFLFRIEKGILDVRDQGVNDYLSSDKIRIPFRNMVYIGDSDTDIPCMKLVNTSGGFSIGVFDAEKNDKAKVYKMMREKRIKYFAPADYSEGSSLDKLVKTIIDRTAYNESLENYYYQCKKEYLEADKQLDETENRKIDGIIDLEGSRSFSRTHEIIREISDINNWSDEQKDQLCKIAIENSQIFCILQDDDIKRFFNKLLRKKTKESEYMKMVHEKIK